MNTSEHPLCCDCLDCLGGGPWPGAGKVVPAEEHIRLTAKSGKCVNGHPLVLSNRVMRRGRLSYECKTCRREYNAQYYDATRRSRLGAKKRVFKSGRRFL